ncbi:fimbrial biogenesis chaperone [Enterobacter ludwigii]|uniref:fimbrial biogenesis chaperone n=1 Tax=Enterobacter ludwigii TaxID=299767 RepID=UPI00397501C7
MKNKLIKVLFCCCFMLTSHFCFSGGFSLAKNRIVINEGEGGGIKVLNTSNVPVLIQSWVSFYKESDAKKYGGKVPFSVSPPLYRQDPGSNYVKIFILGNDFPKNRESVFYFNAKAIPAAISDNGDIDKNKISFSFTNTIKVFYRPSGLTGGSTEAYKKLTFSKVGDRLMVKNVTPYYITFNKIVIAGRSVKDVAEMVPPFGLQSYTIPEGATGPLKYQTINEFGGVTPAVLVDNI